MSNVKAFLRFKEQLETRQLAHDPDRDIREHVLSLTGRRVGFGYVSETLKSRFGANLPNLFKDIVAVDKPGIESADVYLALGTISSEPEKSHKGAVRLFNAAPVTKDILLFEAGFLATTHSWAHSFKEGNPSQACLGYVYDDIAHYFMADYPNRLIQKLNGHETPSDEELARAARLLERIVKQRISKYNAQPMQAPVMTTGYPRRVLVCDQTYADASTVYGKVGDVEFERMLLAAIAENPDAEILVKTHPDSVWEKDKRTGYYAHLQSTGRVRILRDPVNPYVLFDLVETVYVGTSQMGLEALFAGKKVVTFGAPFYAGWGLTEDRQKIPHRQRNRTLTEIFHYFYIWYTIYHLPGRNGPAEIEDVLSYIERNRPYPLPLTEAEITAPPRVSVILPVHGVEKYIEECITSIQRQTLREIEIIPINDASPDGSQTIIDGLAAEDPRIRPILLSENIGQGFARNRGLEAARGEYIFFIDSDDWIIDSELLRKLVAVADKTGADMIRSKKAGEAVFDSDDTLITIREDETERHFSNDIDKTTFRDNQDILHNRHFWLWMYRRSFIEKNSIRFLTTQWEERAFLLKALLSAEVLSLTTFPGIMYRVRPESTARREKGTTDVERFLQNFEQICALLKEHGAVDRSSPLRPHLNFQISQFFHLLFFGFWYPTLTQAGGRREPYLERLAKALEEVDFQSTDLSDAPLVVKKDYSLTQVYRLITTALRARKFEWIETAVASRPVAQIKLYQELLKAPSTMAQEEFQSALSLYARNELVESRGPTLESPAKPRIVIHIGATKTGSTFIQHMLEKNRPALLRQGVWFPEVGLYWQPTRPHKQAGHSEFTRSAVRNDPALRDHIRRGLNLMDGRIHTIVLSSEAYFLNRNAHQLANYFAGHPIEMVIYLRRQDEWANSQYCEFVAGGAVGRVDVPIDEWLKLPETRRRLDYMVPLKAWTDTIGIENVHVRIFDRKEFEGGDLITDFAQAAKLPELLDLPRPDAREQNDARLANGHVELLRLFNQRPFASQEKYFNFIEEAGTALTGWRRDHGMPLPKPWMLSVEQADSIMAEFAPTNATIARDYLKRPDKSLFGPRGPIPDQIPVFAEEMALVEQIYQRHAQQKGAVAFDPKVTVIKATWPLIKQIRVALKKVWRRKSIVFERPLLWGNPFTLEPRNIERYGIIKKQWPKRKRARVILKNIYLGRPILFR
ncbi:capsular polysaccharide export protein [Mycoplana sp. BE70]|uniref:glycosyltransferase n=1 Tax=Mycoplana sp. BE70 TaxID=2817775 RepID=UPI00286348D8|nr:glycosyltransferase [Mycoplana sp. BE70]MDR6755218.1 capsular polysaccharide export protein [Mycoplana sp. BE70]